MNLFIVFVFVVQTSLFFIDEAKASCSISISSLKPEPIVVSSRTYQFLYPEPNAKEVYLACGEPIIISCPGGELYIPGPNRGTSIEATCKNGTQFKVNGQEFNFNEIRCSKDPVKTVKYTTRTTCKDGAKEIEVGFELTTNSFARQIAICFDDQERNNLYSFFELTKSIGHSENDVSRRCFVEGHFYNLGKKVDYLYTLRVQRLTINALLGLNPTSTKYIQNSSDYYLARGHLAAKADFVYAPQQIATFHYVNAAPQWHTFNSGNWKMVENSVRNYSKVNRVDLKVYTGTYRVTTLPHEQQTNREIPLYLYVDNGGTKAIPVPELFWKVVYNPATKQGLALLGVNNPYKTTKSFICEDISSFITWVHWNRANQKAGFSYACEVDDLRRRIPYLPDFEVRGPLL